MSQRLPTFLRLAYEHSPDTGDDKDVEEVEAHGPLPSVKSSSAGDASDELYSAGETHYGGVTDGIDGVGSPAEEHSLSAAEQEEERTLPAGPQANPIVKSTPASTRLAPRWKTKFLRIADTGLSPGSSRRPWSSATNNAMALNRKAIGAPPQTDRSRLSSPQDSATGSRQRSEPLTYNVRNLIQQQLQGQHATAARKMTIKPGKGTAKESTSEEVKIEGHGRKRPLHNGIDEGPDVANSSNSASKFIAKRPRKDETVPPASQGPSALWKYIEPWVLDGGDLSDSVRFTDDVRFSRMLSLPMQRAIEWNDTARNAWKVSGKYDVIALLMELTGEESPSPCLRCTSDPKYGQWVGCKVLPSKMADEAWNIYGCANCVYHGKQTYCSLKDWNRARATRHSAFEAPSKEGSLVGDAQKLATGGLAQSEARPQATRDSTTGHPLSSQAVYQDNSGAILRAKPSQSGTGTSLVSAGGDFRTLTMEPWEKAPGRIRSRNAGTIANIAYSKSYLANGHEIPVCNEAAFRVEVIRSGHVYHFTPQKDTIRLCSLAAGKIAVNMDGEDRFTIGTHGMFRILPESGCLVENEIYDDVTLHVTSIKVGNI
ncbi:hypothetical protein VPNG_06190 [Cytospora leucostoma]|uniref:Uncharacterized protein n=1 Tax=Cytospora leucostoma TaxID=1230097 RepID=A0A423WYE9_9PEZI|nr:hypothetical protein VPNG_06190 [Cytospora leucostoma]